jgi:integrase
MGIRQLSKLNPQEIDTLGDGLHSDGGSLYLKVTDEGRRRSWVFRFTRNGRVTAMGLGKAGKGGVSLKEARARRDEHAASLNDGVNPLAARRRKEREEAAKKTFSEVATSYYEEKERKWSASSRAAWRRFLNRDAKPISDLPVESIGREDIKRVVAALRAMTGSRKPGVATARLAQARVQTVLAYAGEHGWRPEESRVRWSQIAEYAKGEGKRHHPALIIGPDDENADAILAAIARVRLSPSMSARVLEFVALTAVRISEAVEARWSEINLRTATWTVSAARIKMAEPHSVPLSDRAMEIVGWCAQRRINDFVIFGHRDGKPISRETVYDQCQRVTGGKGRRGRSLTRPKP